MTDMSRSRKSAGGTVLTVISLLLAFFMLFVNSSLTATHIRFDTLGFKFF